MHKIDFSKGLGTVCILAVSLAISVAIFCHMSKDGRMYIKVCNSFASQTTTINTKMMLRQM